MAEKKLTRSVDRKVAGVCGGIAEYFGVDPTVIRIAYVILTFFSAGFPGLVLYLILMLLMPEKPQGGNQVEDVEFKDVKESK